ncbi:MAG: deoxyribonuclease IV [Desulfobacterales bacterium]|nr:deoxyribonuclease IV [Desulfobacterales bacterium]
MSLPHPLGAHFSVAGGLENALFKARDLNCDAVQIFTKNARTWKEPELNQTRISAFKAARKETGISWVFSHCTYLINIASNDGDKLEKSRNSLASEMERSGLLGLDGVVLHPGAHLGEGMEKGLDTARKSINRVLAIDRGLFPELLIETTAGTGTSIGSRFEEIGTLINSLDRPEAVGVCMDTSHIFAGGYDLRSLKALDETLLAFNEHIGLSRLKLIHLNDSKPGLGSKKDRHQHIGKGQIGDSGFSAIMQDKRLHSIPKILETPKDDNGTPMDQVNLNRLKKLAQG